MVCFASGELAEFPWQGSGQRIVRSTPVEEAGAFVALGHCARRRKPSTPCGSPALLHRLKGTRGVVANTAWDRT